MCGFLNLCEPLPAFTFSCTVMRLRSENILSILISIRLRCKYYAYCPLLSSSGCSDELDIEETKITPNVRTCHVTLFSCHSYGVIPNLNFAAIHSLTMSKRGPSPTPGGALVKRAKATPPPSNQIAISSSNDDRNKGLIRTVQRTSNLEAPIISLAGAHSVRCSISLEDTLNRYKTN